MKLEEKSKNEIKMRILKIDSQVNQVKPYQKKNARDLTFLRP